MSATAVTVARLFQEEGYRLLPYDDSTGVPVKAPGGSITWGVGFNLMECGSRGLFTAMLTYLVGQIEMQLQSIAWYPGLPVNVQSVCQDIAYNGGFHGFLNHPKMIYALAHGDIATAADECSVADPKLDASRYAPLRAIMRA